MGDLVPASGGGAVSLAAGSWSSRRVLVTGATGMVGSWLVKDLLEAGAAVVALRLARKDHLLRAVLGS